MRLEITQSFLQPKEIQALNAWVDEAIANKWMGVGLSLKDDCANRLTTRFYGERFVYPQLALGIRDRIKEHLGFSNAPWVTNHGRDGIVVSYTKRGGDVHPHKDPKSYSDLATLRCNVLTQASEEGGELVLDGKKVSPDVGDLHCYLASEYEHYVTEVKGDTPRILWMFGVCVPKKEWEPV